MSTPDFFALRADLLAYKEKHGDGAYPALSRLLGGKPSDEAIRLFAEGHTKAPRFAEDLANALGGRVTQPDLAEEAEQALRLIRQGQERLERVAQRLRMSAEVAESVTAADDVTLLEQPDQPTGEGTGDVSASARRRRKGR
jgi:hypothetical protein